MLFRTSQSCLSEITRKIVHIEVTFPYGSEPLVISSVFPQDNTVDSEARQHLGAIRWLALVAGFRNVISAPVFCLKTL